MRTLKSCLASVILLGTSNLGMAAVTQIEGAGGGGIVPWALLAGDDPKQSMGGTASYTFITTGNFDIHSVGAAASFGHLAEISYAHHYLGLPESLQTATGTSEIQQNVFGAKFKLLGMNGMIPQIALGVQYKQNSNGDLVRALGARDDSGTDFYLAATNVYPVGGKKLLLNGTVRATKANWFGLLGFGGPDNDSYEAQFEGSAGLFLNDQTVLGAEYRMKPDNLKSAGLAENDAYDGFIAYFPNKNLALVAAYAGLGQIATKQDQNGLYLQVQASF
ncbi:DUF3034 family protein [Thermithiobacillus plumbiphilus]|uniref:DUF3034 family protein n=1 Tax=Thermithiobacillus plumbiphilus TaxID=1729899 RepID=A0ABU9DA88_9PROT